MISLLSSDSKKYFWTLTVITNITISETQNALKCTLVQYANSLSSLLEIIYWEEYKNQSKERDRAIFTEHPVNIIVILLSWTKTSSPDHWNSLSFCRISIRDNNVSQTRDRLCIDKQQQTRIKQWAKKSYLHILSCWAYLQTCRVSDFILYLNDCLFDKYIMKRNFCCESK